jgi:hypothetical protein
LVGIADQLIGDAEIQLHPGVVRILRQQSLEDLPRPVHRIESTGAVTDIQKRDSGLRKRRGFAVLQIGRGLAGRGELLLQLLCAAENVFDERGRHAHLRAKSRRKIVDQTVRCLGRGVERFDRMPPLHFGIHRKSGEGQREQR